jgi:hypothetical protein
MRMWAAIFIFSAHAVLVTFLGEGVWDKGETFAATFILWLMLCSSERIASLLLSIPDRDFFRVFIAISFALLSLGVCSLIIPQDFLGYDKYAKSIFPYQEPSHFGLVLALTVMPCIHLFRLWSWPLLLITLCQQSAVLLVLYVLSMILYVVLRGSMFFSLWLLVITGFFIFDSGLETEYYSERLNVSGSSQNLSVLVWLQGWEEGLGVLSDTYGLGGGFRATGEGPPGEISESIAAITNGLETNRNSSGSLAARLTSDFGLTGLLIVLYYFRSLTLSLKRILVRKKTHYNDEKKLLAAHLITIGFSLEMFVRGGAYLSPGVFLFMVSVILIHKCEARRLLQLP